MSWFKIADHEYHAHPNIGSHKLMRALRSHNHFENMVSKETDAMNFGRLVHLAVLEPEEFVRRVCVIPKIDRRTKEGKLMFEGLKDSLEGSDKLVTNEEDMQTILAIKQACRAKKTVRELLENCVVEHSAFTPFQGIDAKIKPDAFHREKRYLIDLKTCLNAGAFKRDIYKYNYQFQAAFYLDVASHLDKVEYNEFYFIALEKEAPHELIVYRLSEDLLVQGREMYKRAIDNLSKHGGYEDKIHELSQTENQNFLEEMVW